MAMGMDGLGNLAGVVGWMQQRTPQNFFGDLNAQLVGAPTPIDASLGASGGLPTAVPGVDFESLRGTLMQLQAQQQTRDESDRLFAESKEAELETAKRAFWADHHYEWRNGPNSEPEVVNGPETADQTRARQTYEQRQLEAFQSGQEARANSPAGPNCAQLLRWQQDPEGFRAFLQTPNGQQEYMRMSEAAQAEEEVRAIRERAREIQATMPPQLHGRVDAALGEILERRNASRAAVQASPEARQVQDFQSRIQQWVGGQQGALQQEREDNWQPFRPQVMPASGGTALSQPAFQLPFDPSQGSPVAANPGNVVAGPQGGQMPLLNPALFQQGGGALINPGLFQRPV